MSRVIAESCKRSKARLRRVPLNPDDPLYAMILKGRRSDVQRMEELSAAVRISKRLA